MSAALITLNEISLAFGHLPLLDKAELTIHPEERIGLIGRNGTGKSSLLKLLDGRLLPDDGEIMRRSGLKIATVAQEPDLDGSLSVLDTITQGYLEDEDWQRPARAQALIDQLGLDTEALVGTLSGGTRKRVALAHALVSKPDLLLLDEPTNHLDFDGIAWLESHLRAASFSVVVVTHDRRFLDMVATRIIELDRGLLFSFPGNFSDWQVRKAQWLQAQAQQNAKFDKVLAQEEVWIRKGVEARRTRNEGRVRRLEQLRRERAQRRERSGDVRLALDQGQRSGKLVAELEGIRHGFGDRTLIRDLSTTVLRGDRIGLIGPNGAGKTTLLNIILGKLTPDAGSVRLGTHLSVAYFDQMRAQLDENATLADTISPGSEWVEIGTQRKHVMSYLEDFLFPPARAHSPVRSLSGGERARLSLARLFARPVNVLVMDEPTNDLDIETLELLEELLQDYSGTVLLVSHDRAFLDNVVTQTLAAEGDGQWGEYVGGYDEWLAQRPAPQQTQERRKKEADAPAPRAAEAPKPEKAQKSRITSWEQRELDGIPDAIAEMEARQESLTARLADGTLYRDAPSEVDAIQQELADIETKLEALFARWELLEGKRGA